MPPPAYTALRSRGVRKRGWGFYSFAAARTEAGNRRGGRQDAGGVAAGAGSWVIFTAEA